VTIYELLNEKFKDDPFIWMCDHPSIRQVVYLNEHPMKRENEAAAVKHGKPY